VFACAPHPGLGTVRIRERPALVRVVNLTTCRARTVAAPAPAAQAIPGARVVAQRHGAAGRQSIVARGRTVFSVRESYRRVPAGSPGPIALFGTTARGRWILFGIDPMGSQSIVADGWTIQAVSVRGGGARTVTFGLPNDDYRTWCGGELVVVAGGDRVATHTKWLVAAKPPDWRPHVVFKSRRIAFGSLACAPDGRSVVVESARSTGANESVRVRWSLDRVGLDGSRQRLTSPPPGSSDESPRVAGAAVYFVRGGSLFALRRGTLVGPLLRIPEPDGYYGHRTWPYAVRR
jgi:hypothetical protein